MLNQVRRVVQEARGARIRAPATTKQSALESRISAVLRCW
ncbi:Hypothetical protein A7982_04427 [Minicystis rosea]|nr:Hypothetical protein A7982_04427 [Minicystis rosea]